MPVICSKPRDNISINCNKSRLLSQPEDHFLATNTSNLSGTKRQYFRHQRLNDTQQKRVNQECWVSLMTINRLQQNPLIALRSLHAVNDEIKIMNTYRKIKWIFRANNGSVDVFSTQGGNTYISMNWRGLLSCPDFKGHILCKPHCWRRSLNSGLGGLHSCLFCLSLNLSLSITHTRSYSIHFLKMSQVGLVWLFNGTSTFAGYLMPKPFFKKNSSCTI